METKEVENSRFQFLNEYIRNHREVGSIVPDSKACVDALLRFVPFQTANVIVEFGPASGAVTREIIFRKRAETLLISFEKNPSFYMHLRRNLTDPNLSFVQDDAMNAANIMSERFGLGEKSVDCLVSTLPCSSIQFSKLLRAAVLPLMKDNSVFIQYMHTISFLKRYRLRPLLERHFTRINRRLVVRNLPPALIYTCRK